MKQRSKSFARLAFAAASFLPFTALACSSCGCTLSQDWENQGMSANPGLRVDFRVDYINQNQLRHGRGTASASDVAAAQAAGTLGETEQYTQNHYYTLGIDYTIDRAWGVNVQVPYMDRTHGTIQDPPAAMSSSQSKSLGDIKILGRYQGFSEDGDTGLLFGLKLPTGKYDTNFTAGPASMLPPPNNALDRSLQAGTGSTDVIVGMYRFGSLNQDWDWFAQGFFQAAVSTRDGFRPGNAVNLNAGVRYMDFGVLVPQLQVNAKTGWHDTGPNADTADTGGRIVYLSPGATVAVSHTVRLYGFVQLPLYQRVEGFQLAPRWNASLGVNFSM